MNPPTPLLVPATLDAMAKCIVAYCANTRPCSAHDRPARPWARSRRRPTARSRSAAERTAILEDHGYRCHMCKVIHPAGELELDHVIPLGEGGPDLPSNLRPACRPCHHRKTAAEAARARRGRPR